MFRRSKTDSSPASATSATSATSGAPVQLGKGRPTPSRREAEAAARARARASASPGSTGKGTREQRASAARAAREGIKNGDDRYLRPRDHGPVRRFVRDFVDARLSMAELAVPGFILSFLVSAVGSQAVGSGLLNALLLVIVVDSVLLRFRLRRELKRRFPDTDLSGTTFYAIVRALQIRFLRLPKPQVGIGAKLPERYR